MQTTPKIKPKAYHPVKDDPLVRTVFTFLASGAWAVILLGALIDAIVKANF